MLVIQSSVYFGGHCGFYQMQYRFIVVIQLMSCLLHVPYIGFYIILARGEGEISPFIMEVFDGPSLSRKISTELLLQVVPRNGECQGVIPFPS